MDSYCFSDEENLNKLNTALIITGYDTYKDGVYYKCLTTFGKDFANDGFIYIKAFENTCGISSMAIALDMQYFSLY